MAILAGRGGFCPTNLNECRDLRGHPRKHKPALKGLAPFWSTIGDDAKTAIGDIFHFSFKDLRFSMALMQWQLAAEKYLRWRFLRHRQSCSRKEIGIAHV